MAILHSKGDDGEAPGQSHAEWVLTPLVLF